MTTQEHIDAFFMAGYINADIHLYDLSHDQIEVLKSNERRVKNDAGYANMIRSYVELSSAFH